MVESQSAVIRELQTQIAELAKDADSDAVREEIERLQAQLEALKQSPTGGPRDAWDRVLLARHPQRPHTLDYIQFLFTDFTELHGDRRFADDPSIVCGMARFEDQTVMVVGHQKGRDTKAKVFRNFGMPRPEGYRKALRLMNFAARFRLPLLTFIDTPGAYPGVGAEERGQSEAIARNLEVMSRLPVPVVCTIIGEGGSGGALAIGVGDRVNMLEYSTYSVISPEGCASILWKDAANAEEAATALGITSDRLKALGLIDEIIPEPLGGAHKEPDEVARRIADCIERQLEELSSLPVDTLLESRYLRLLSYGEFQG